MNRLVSILIAFGLALTSLLVVTAPQAQAMGGCRVKVLDKFSDWENMDYYFTTPTLRHDHTLNVTGSLFYWHCNYKGKTSDVIKPRYIRWCYEFQGNSEEHKYFQGVKVNGVVLTKESNDRINPPEFNLPDRNTRRVCRNQNLPDPEWMLMRHTPVWGARADITLTNGVHVGGPFVTVIGTRFKHITPAADRTVGRPHH